MAAIVSSSVWGLKSKPGSWALDAEDHDDELQSAAAVPEPPSAEFPTLAAAATTKTKKKKAQTLSLAEFSTYSSTPKFSPSATNSQRLTADELVQLPTGPRERSAEELERSRGGGFRNFGYDTANSRSRVSERGNSSRDEGFSRADEADDWSKSKKPVGGDGREKVGFFNSSRADEVDNWASNKSFTPSEGRIGRRNGSDSFSNGADSDNWARRKEESGAGGQRFERERRGLGFESSGGADSDNWMKKKDQNSGAVADSGRPKLNLQPRTVAIISSGNEVKMKGSNPFGEARPREEVLKEMGKDWKEIDDKLESLKVKEDGAVGSARSGTFKDDLMEKRSWRKSETQNSTPSSDDQVEKGDADDAEEVAAEKTENGVAENN